MKLEHPHLQQKTAWLNIVEASTKQEIGTAEPTPRQQALLGGVAILRDAVERTMIIPVDDGNRVVGVRRYGATNGTPFMWHHGSPTGAVSYNEPYLAESGISLYVVDRPGYGVSTPHPGRNHASVGRDLKTVANSIIGDNEYFSGGYSGGAPFATTAALRDPRIKGVLAMATLASPDLLKEDQHKNVVASNRRHFEEGYNNSLPEVAHRFKQSGFDGLEVFGDDAENYRQWYEHPSRWAKHFASHIWALTGPHGQTQAEGWVEDCYTNNYPWNVDLAQVNCPVSVVAFDKDNRTTMDHALAFAAALPQHHRRFSVVQGDHIGNDFHTWIAAMAGVPAPVQAMPTGADDSPDIVWNFVNKQDLLEP